MVLRLNVSKMTVGISLKRKIVKLLENASFGIITKDNFKKVGLNLINYWILSLNNVDRWTQMIEIIWIFHKNCIFLFQKGWFFSDVTIFSTVILLTFNVWSSQLKLVE